MKERNVFEILSMLDRKNKPLNSEQIRCELEDLGIPLTDRMVRNYLQDFDKKGFTDSCGRDGRCITEKGRDELRTSFIYARTDFIFDLTARTAMAANFDLTHQRGELSTSSCMIKESQEAKARKILEEVCQSSLFPQRVKITHAGERIYNRIVPEGAFCLTVITCVAIDQILVNNGIFLRFGDSVTIEVRDKKPFKCTSFVSGVGVSFDPFKSLIEHKQLNVQGSTIKGEGEVLAEYCEIPYTVRAKVINLLRKATSIIGGTVVVGGYSGSLLGIPTRSGYCGFVTFAGESLFEALEANGIKTKYETLLGTVNIKELTPVAPVKGEVLLL